MRRNLLSVSLAGAALAAGSARAQPAPDASRTPPPDPASETVLPPEPVTGTPTPPPPAASPDQPVTVDQLVIGAGDRIDANFFGDVSLYKISDEDPAFAVGPI